MKIVFHLLFYVILSFHVYIVCYGLGKLWKYQFCFGLDKSDNYILLTIFFEWQC